MKFCLGHTATTKLMNLPPLFEKLYWWSCSSWSRGKGRLHAISVPSFGSCIHQWFAQKSWNQLAVFFCKEGEPTSASHCFLHGAWRNAFVSEKDGFLQPWLEALKLIYLATRERQLAAMPPSYSCCKAGRSAAILDSISRHIHSRGNQGLNCKRGTPPAKPNKVSSCWCSSSLIAFLKISLLACSSSSNLPVVYLIIIYLPFPMCCPLHWAWR